MKIEDIFKTLKKHRVKYAVAGGVAVVLHGYIRFTHDVDLIIDFSKANVARFVAAMKELNFRPGVPINPLDLADTKKRRLWQMDKNAKTITFYQPAQSLLQIDVLLIMELSRTVTIRKKVGNFFVPVIDYEELIRMKRRANRLTDQIDIEKLKEIKK